MLCGQPRCCHLTNGRTRIYWTRFSPDTSSPRTARHAADRHTVAYHMLRSPYKGESAAHKSGANVVLVDGADGGSYHSLRDFRRTYSRCSRGRYASCFTRVSTPDWQDWSDLAVAEDGILSRGGSGFILVVGIGISVCPCRHILLLSSAHVLDCADTAGLHVGREFPLYRGVRCLLCWPKSKWINRTRLQCTAGTKSGILGHPVMVMYCRREDHAGVTTAT